MILDLPKFLARERPLWNELEALLARLAEGGGAALDLAQARRLHYLYERTSSDLARVQTFVAERELRGYLEGLVTRAYGEIHESRRSSARFQPVRWFLDTFPQCFRRRVAYFKVSLAATLAGCAFGAAALLLDPGAKETLLPFGHLQGDPSERVAEEEDAATADRLDGHKSSFAAHLMTHNIQVSIFAMALGMTWGVGSLVMLFYNGVILGAVTADYIAAGEAKFLVGWLLPHGSVEIPAILIAGQAGLLLAHALIGWRARQTMRDRFRAALPDLVTLMGGVAVLLVWAGVMESFFSQYHEPVLPYAVKILVGLVECALLAWLLLGSGRRAEAP
jgi:uncharacterized membrane protein SpoIIM required for sporulation